MIFFNVEIKDELVLEIGKFTILWAEFEKKYCNNDCNSAYIWKLAEKYIVDQKILYNLSESLKVRVDLYDEDTEVYVKYNLSPEGCRKPSPADLKIIEDFINFKGEHLLVGAMLSIYRIRNNLFHGLKELSCIDKQLPLFQSMNKVLSSIGEQL